MRGRSIRDAAACGSILGPRAGLEAAPTVGWSEIIDYLLVDVIAIMLSHVTNQVKEKVEGLRARFQIGNLAPTLFAKNAEKDGAPGRWPLLFFLMGSVRNPHFSGRGIMA